MELKQHKAEVEKLTKIELELAELIAETNDHSLMDKFTEFQDQRFVCNTSFANWVDQILNDCSVPRTDDNA